MKDWLSGVESYLEQLKNDLEEATVISNSGQEIQVIKDGTRAPFVVKGHFAIPVGERCLVYRSKRDGRVFVLTSLSSSSTSQSIYKAGSEPSVPQNITIKIIGNILIATWKPVPTLNDFLYELQVSDQNNGTNARTCFIGHASATASFIDLSAPVLYCRMRAINQSGRQSAWTDWIEVLRQHFEDPRFENMLVQKWELLTHDGSQLSKIAPPTSSFAIDKLLVYRGATDEVKWQELTEALTGEPPSAIRGQRLVKTSPHSHGRLSLVPRGVNDALLSQTPTGPEWRRLDSIIPFVSKGSLITSGTGGWQALAAHSEDNRILVTRKEAARGLEWTTLENILSLSAAGEMLVYNGTKLTKLANPTFTTQRLLVRPNTSAMPQWGSLADAIPAQINSILFCGQDSTPPNTPSWRPLPPPTNIQPNNKHVLAIQTDGSSNQTLVWLPTDSLLDGGSSSVPSLSKGELVSANASGAYMAVPPPSSPTQYLARSIAHPTGLEWKTLPASTIVVGENTPYPMRPILELSPGHLIGISTDYSPDSITLSISCLLPGLGSGQLLSGTTNGYYGIAPPTSSNQYLTYSPDSPTNLAWQTLPASTGTGGYELSLNENPSIPMRGTLRFWQGLGIAMELIDEPDENRVTVAIGNTVNFYQAVQWLDPVNGTIFMPQTTWMRYVAGDNLKLEVQTTSGEDPDNPSDDTTEVKYSLADNIWLPSPNGSIGFGNSTEVNAWRIRASDNKLYIEHYDGTEWNTVQEYTA